MSNKDNNAYEPILWICNENYICIFKNNDIELDDNTQTFLMSSHVLGGNSYTKFHTIGELKQRMKNPTLAPALYPSYKDSLFVQTISLSPLRDAIDNIKGGSRNSRVRRSRSRNSRLRRSRSRNSRLRRARYRKALRK
jgi:hypothetical protein